MEEWKWNLAMLFSGQTYKFRISNAGISTSINFRIQGHTLTLVEVEGSHTMQEVYDSLDVHVGQSVTVLVKLNSAVKDYFIVASSRFTKPILTTTALLRYAGSNTPPSLPLPIGPTYHVHWSMKQARTIRLSSSSFSLTTILFSQSNMCLVANYCQIHMWTGWIWQQMQPGQILKGHSIMGL